jgi:class 3 adenylate cyclase
VGIHYGEALLGLIGTHRRLEYTAIGDSVNIAKRIQENASGGQILISAAAYTQVEQVVIAHPIGELHAKGKSEPIPVYTVAGLR